MKRISVLLAMVVFLVGCVSALNAAATIYGMSGLIETPDDTIASAKTLTPVYSRIVDLHVVGGGDGFDVSTYGGALGIIPNLEVSVVGVTPEDWGHSEGLVNAKYRLVAESVDKPSVTVGVVDMAKRLDSFTDGVISDTSAFVVIGKNISNVAEGVSGQVSKPVKATLGFGTGLYNGIFGGVDIAVAPKFSVAVEYLTKGIRAESTFNGCVRFQPTGALSIDAGAIGFKDFFAGASYNVSTF